MNIRRLLMLVVFGSYSFCIGLAANDGWISDWNSEPGLPPPLHPTILMGMYKDHPCRVVGVSGNYGVVEHDGTTARLSSSASYEPVRASAYLPGQITVKWQHASSNQQIRTFLATGHKSIESESSDYAAGIVASQDYKGCYIVLIFFDQGYLNGTTDDPSATFAFQEVGDLPAGVETKVTANYGYVDPKRKRLVCTVLYFSRGTEIRTSNSGDSSRLFRRVEMLRHEKLLALYQEKNPHGTFKAVPYLRFPPIFTDPEDLKRSPPELKATYTVRADGTVGDLQLSSVVPTSVLVDIQRAIEGWLYFPKLENGRPHSSFVSIELDIQHPN